MKNIFLLLFFVSACTVATDDNFQNPFLCRRRAPSAQTSNVIGCTAGSIGYTCTSDRPDDGDTNLVCSAGKTAAGATAYCCLPFAQSFNECTTSTTIAGCADPGFGFSCAGQVGPADVDSRLACSHAIDSSYCCVASDIEPSCVSAPAAACAGASIGFSCVSNASPGDGNASVACDGGTAGENGATTRCCIPFLQTESGCEENQHVGCASGAFGFSCAGLARPEDSNASLTCSSGSIPSSYCCTL